MPLSKYFKGKGSQVMRSMQKEYGAKKGKSVFYATANKQHQTAEDYKNPKHSHPFSYDPSGKGCLICDKPKSMHKIS